MDFEWTLLTANQSQDCFAFEGTAGNYGADPTTWGIYPAILAYLPELPAYDVAWFCIKWRAYMRTFAYDTTPTRYQGVLPKYKLGTWAQSIGGWQSAEGFINYSLQYLTSGIFNTYSNIYYPYDGENQGYPIGQTDSPQQIDEYGFTSVLNPDTRILRGDELYTQFDVTCVQVLTLRCEATSFLTPSRNVYPVQL
jgi:hypothetical protein